MESNQRYYLRRASEERTAAIRAMTPAARDWHAKLAGQFAERALVAECAQPVTIGLTRIALSA